MRILVSGCYGFIGYSVAVRLLKMGHEVIGIDKVVDAVSEKKARIHNLEKFAPAFTFYDVNMSNFEQLSTLHAVIKYDAAVHLAGQYSTHYSTKHMLACVDGNIRSFLNLMDCAQRAGTQRIIYASSTFVQDGVPPTTMYGATLDFRERAAHVYGAAGMETVGIRFGSTYGPYLRPDVGVAIILRKLFAGTPINVQEGGFKYNTGMLYISDAVDAVVAMIQRPNEPSTSKVVTLVAHEPVVSLTHILALMEEYTGLQAKRTTEPLVIERGYLPTDKVQAVKDLVGFVPETTIEVGIKKLCDWYKPRFEKGLT